MKRQAVISNVALTALALASAPAASTATLLRNGKNGDGGVGTEEEPRRYVFSAIWPFHSDNDDDIKSGITFERTETSCPVVSSVVPVTWGQFPNRLSQLYISSVKYLTRSLSPIAIVPAWFSSIESAPQTLPHATFDADHCESKDDFGSNSCHYNWGDDVAVKYDGWIGQELDENVYIEISVKIDSLIHHSQTCPICGDDPCAIAVPAIPAAAWSIDLPPCPLTPEFLNGEWKGKLPNQSPLPGILNSGSGTTLQGTVWLKEKGIDIGEEDVVLMKVEGNVHLKQ
mmetsp:Transcript_12018/g.20852  ORF Transcript_12018/g.20852 Transcript_12018/m.20852 type:complete len:285 (+) Transcript_12018:103-957(+)